MERATVILDKDFVIAPVDRNVFSSFVEPLGRCIYGGLYEPGHPQADDKGFRRDVMALTKALNLSLNRFPGGNYTSTYRWEDTVGPRERRPRRADVAWQSIETNEFGLNEFADWSQRNGSGVMMTVNLATRGVLEAMDCVEYCNLPGGTYWSDLRAAHGYKRPHGFRYWCLTNEIDGAWQVGQTTAAHYGLLAREAAKGMKLLDPGIKTVLAGSSSPGMPSFPAFDGEALEIAYDYVDYLSIHQYIGNAKDDTPNYLAKSLLTDDYFRKAAAAIDYAAAKRHSAKQVHISFDEFNTWHSISDQKRFDDRWRIAPPLLEDTYTMEDALALGSMLLSVLRRADRVKIACVSELCNAISHIRTRTGGGAWVMPPYYAMLHFSRYGRGDSLVTKIESPRYDSTDFTDVPYLDAHGVLAEDGGLTVFAINRSLTDALPLEIDLRGFGDYVLEGHTVLESPGNKDTNTEEAPHAVQPRDNGDAFVDGRRVSALLPRLSWNVIRLRKTGANA